MEVFCTMHGFVEDVPKKACDKTFESHMSRFPNTCDYRHYEIKVPL